MQIGDVDFDTAATDDYNFVFVGVAEPGDVVDAVDQATGVAVGRDARAGRGPAAERSLTPRFGPL